MPAPAPVVLMLAWRVPSFALYGLYHFVNGILARPWF